MSQSAEFRNYCLQFSHHMRVSLMKLITRCGVLMMALTSLGAGTVGSALAAPAATGTASTSTAPAGPPHGHFFFRGRGPGGGFLLGSLLRATRQLNLSSDQQTQIKGILSAARSQARSAGPAGGTDITVLGNPADPNYAAAVQAAQLAASNRIQQESELESQVYNVLTTEQRTQLPTVLASLKAQAAARRSQHGSVAQH
jgi:Spy/CpxP family protein refolding chaperone